MNRIQAVRNEALSAYESYYARDLVSEEQARYGALQAAMLAEIALQLDRIATSLSGIEGSVMGIAENTTDNPQLENVIERLSRIGSIIMDK